MSAKIKSRSNKIRESKWEKIRKKHINCIKVTTETVRKFLKMEFVDEDKLLPPSCDTPLMKTRLDPVVVMNLRHELIKRTPKNVPSRIKTAPSIKPVKENPDELLLIDKELKKFKQEMNKLKTVEKPPPSDPKNKKKSILISLSNVGIFNSLSDSEEKTKDFYETMISSTQHLSSSKDNPRLTEEKVSKPMVHFADETVRIQSEDATTTEYTNSTNSSEIDEAELIEMLISKEKRKEDKTIVTFSEKTYTFERCRYFSQEKDSESDQSQSVSEDTDTLSSDINLLSQMVQFGQVKEEEDEELIGGLKNLCISGKELRRTDDQTPQDFTKEELSIVTEFFESPTNKNVLNRKKVLGKYFMKWVHYTTIQKITKDSNLTSKSQRMTNIDAYLSRIRDEKKKAKKITKENSEDLKTNLVKSQNAIVLVKKYQSKMKVQQDIIDLQKVKLERQERMIAELRLAKLSEDAKKFKQDLKDELNKVMKTGDVRLRAKAKCLQMVSNLKSEEDEDKLTAYGNMIPRFLAKMQERAMERQLKHEQAKERRMRLDQEKEEVKQYIEDEKRQADEEAKRLRILELKEKRRQEKLLKLKKEQERLKWIDDNKKAIDFYRIHLLRRYGMDRFKKLVNRKKILEEKSTLLRRRTKIKKCFLSWFLYSKMIWTRKYEMADEYYRIYSLKICMRLWKGNMVLERGKMLLATDWYDMRLHEKYFSGWKAAAQAMKMELENKMKHAKSHYNWHLLWRSVEHWQRLHTINRLERETEARRQRWRHKIWELLPDYTPNNGGD